MIAGATRVLVMGASGQLGSALARRFDDCALVTASNLNAAAGESRVDLGDAALVQRTLSDVRPAVILVAGAMCNVDRCEVESDECDRINIGGPAQVAEYARIHRARVVLFSTDHVFDGEKDGCYVETDPVNPLNLYSASKARAEEALRDLLPDDHLIVRTGWVYGPDRQRRNFVLRLVDRLVRGEKVAVPSDQWGCPSHTDDIAGLTRFLLDRGATGTFHASGPEFVDRATLASCVCRHFGVDDDGVVLTPTCDLAQAARRPLRVRLDCRKIVGLGAPPFRGIDAGLRALAAWSAATREAL